MKTFGSILLAIFVLLVIYACSYAVLMVPAEIDLVSRFGDKWGPVRIWRFPTYRYDSRIGHIIFTPAEWLDLNVVRPRYWSDKES